ncbi:MAG: holo-ACP synthase [Gemmatimonadota bacterium]|nr:holo-ACP synthase [Gemmatimonadota bacterium]
MSGHAVGIDLVTVERVATLLEHHGDRALERLLTSREREYCLGMAVPARHVAARLAAKEAVYKALQGTEDARGIGWQEIEVTRDGDGRPAIQLTGRAAARLAALGGGVVLISLTHTDDLAAAIALVV